MWPGNDSVFPLSVLSDLASFLCVCTNFFIHQVCCLCPQPHIFPTKTIGVPTVPSLWWVWSVLWLSPPPPLQPLSAVPLTLRLHPRLCTGILVLLPTPSLSTATRILHQTILKLETISCSVVSLTCHLSVYVCILYSYSCRTHCPTPVSTVPILYDSCTQTVVPHATRSVRTRCPYPESTMSLLPRRNRWWVSKCDFLRQS